MIRPRSSGSRGVGAPRAARTLLAALKLGPFLTGAAFAASAPSLTFEQPRAEFGIVYQRAVVEQVYPFVNQGRRPVTILAVRPRFEGGTGEAVPPVVPAGGRGVIRVRQPVGDRLGATAFRIALDTDDPEAPLLRLGLSGFVESAYEPQASRIDFGVVYREAGGREQALDMASREVERLEVRSIEGALEFLEVSAAGRSGEVGEGVRLTARVRPGAPIGIYSGTLLVHTNVPNQPEVAVPFSATVYGDVVPERNPVSFGLVRIGQGYEGSVELRSRSGTGFEVQSAVDPDGNVGGEAAPCPGETADAPCRRLNLRGLALASGPFGGTFYVRISGQDAPLPIRYSGLATSPKTQVKSLDFSDSPGEVEAPGLPWKPVSPVPASTSPVAPATVEETPTVPRVNLRWKASNEEGVFGYRVLRSSSRLGPFVRANRDLVLVRLEPKGSHSYVFQDFGVASGATYYYYLDLVTTSGEVRRFSGVLPKTVSSAPGSPPTTDAPSSPNPLREN